MKVLASSSPQLFNKLTWSYKTLWVIKFLFFFFFILFSCCKSQKRRAKFVSVIYLDMCVQGPCGCASCWTPTANLSRRLSGYVSFAGGTAWMSAPWRTVTIVANWPIWPTFCPRALLVTQVRWHQAEICLPIVLFPDALLHHIISLSNLQQHCPPPPKKIKNQVSFQSRRPWGFLPFY